MSQLEEALNELGPMQNKARELLLELSNEVEANRKTLTSLRKFLEDLLGPSHAVPEQATRYKSSIAKPGIEVAFWRYGEWNCLRLEERTIGHNRPVPFTNKGMATLRQHPETERWMGWLSGIARELKLPPLTGSVRLLLFPGLAYTFIAWRNVAQRRKAYLHPMDPDNAAKASTDALSSTYIVDRELRRQKNENARRRREGKPEQPIVFPEPVGAWFDDAQVVDLMVYRLEQSGCPPVDRISLKKKRRAVIKKHKKAKAVQILQEQEAPDLRPSFESQKRRFVGRILKAKNRRRIPNS